MDQLGDDEVPGLEATDFAVRPPLDFFCPYVQRVDIAGRLRRVQDERELRPVRVETEIVGQPDGKLDALDFPACPGFHHVQLTDPPFVADEGDEVTAR